MQSDPFFCSCSSLYAMRLQTHIISRIFFVGVFVGAIAGAWSCGRTITDPAEIVIPESNISFERHILPVFALSCNFSGCHNAETRAGRVALTSYFEVVFNAPGLVVARQPERSVLYRVMNFNAPTRIPHRQSFQQRITQNHIDGVRKWIEEGAQ